MSCTKALRTMIGLGVTLILLVGCHNPQDKTSQASYPFFRTAPLSTRTSIHPHDYKALIQNISVVLEAKQIEYNGAEPVTILFTLTNESDLTISISRWDIPFDGLYNDTFRVVKDDQPIKYIGPLSMIAETRPEDYLTLRPGEVISTTFDLAVSYELKIPGEYIIHYESDFLVMSSKYPKKLAEREDFIIKGIISSEIPIRLQEARLPRPSFVQPVTKHCSQQQQEILIADLQNAVQLACNAKRVLNKRPPDIRIETERYLTWFGEYVKNRVENVTQNFRKICYILSTQAITFECRADCDPVLISSMTPDIEYEMNLCNGFWELVSSGTNSRPGTIIHEMSHFHVIADTDDMVYGKPNCMNLAANSPEKAINNADNYKYFAENDPPLKPDKP